MHVIQKMYKKFAHHSWRYCSAYTRGNLVISDEVSSCIQNKGPIVALESTIITHGMPYPQNLRTARSVEDIVRKNNAVPATIGVIDGKVHIGLNEEQLKFLASKNNRFIKISRRDLPFVMSRKLTGGTTVAATMICAHRAGIRIFVTGGVGGVHRGAETSMDISADLVELSRTPVTVVSAGVKSLLDIGLTLEFLETHGVCVATYGKTREFPAFFTPKSGFFSPCNVESAEEAAELIECRDSLSLENGILIAVPIPESSAADGVEIESSIQRALVESREQNITGKDVTPFVLAKVQEHSGGISLKSNVALIENNALVGSLIAVELAKKTTGAPFGSGSGGTLGGNGTKVRQVPSNIASSAEFRQNTTGRPVVVGGTNLDLNITCLQEELKIDGSTQRGKIEVSAGGVGRNIADCLTRLGSNPFFISAVGEDENGTTVLSKMSHMDSTGISVLGDARTAACAVVLEKKGDCAFVIGDMNVHDRITPDQVRIHEDRLQQAPIVVLDGNIPISTMDYILSVCSENGVPVWFEPTDVNKAGKFTQCSKWKSSVAYASPNLNELWVMHRQVCRTPAEARKPQSLYGVDERTANVIMKQCFELSVPLLEHLVTVVVTLGPLGALLVTREPKDQPFRTKSSYEARCNRQAEIRAEHYLPLKPQGVASVSGAGDCFAAAMIGAIVRGCDQKACLRAAMTAAILSMAFKDAVPSSITSDVIDSALANRTAYPGSRDITFRRPPE